MNFKYYLSIAVVILMITVIGTSANAQIIKGAAIVGLNASQVEGDEVKGFDKLGFDIGAAAIVPFAGNWSFTLEGLYTQKGSFSRNKFMYGTPPEGVPYQYSLKLNYVEIPVLIHYTDKDIIRGGVGFSYSRLLGGEEKEFQKITKPVETLYKKDDYNLLADVQVRLFQNLWMDMRYSYSLVPIRERVFTDSKGNKMDREQFNNSLSLRLIWVFKEEKINRRYRELRKQ
ncbi:MAG: porin family protein [Hyphomicrobiales bacterium]